MLTQFLGSNNLNAQRKLALLGAFCLLLSALEYMVPKPLPFMRIGLANLPLMLALDIFSLKAFVILICIKILGQALITGTLFSYIFLFSLFGTFFSAMLMYALRRLLGAKRISFIGVGAAGAIVSNSAQLALAWFFLFRENVFYIIPPFLGAGLITGILLGVFCEAFSRKSKWLKNETISNDQTQLYGGEIGSGQLSGVPDEPDRVGRRQALYNKLFSAKALFIAGLLIMPALVFNPRVGARVAQFFFFWFLVVLSGTKTRLPFKLFIVAVIIFFNLIVPYGRVLFSVGPLRITSGALLGGIQRAATFQGLFMLSKLSVRQDLVIPGAFGKILAQSLQMFSLMMNRQQKMRKKIKKNIRNRMKMKLFQRNLFIDLDNLMLSLSSENTGENIVRKQKTTPVGYAILVLVIVLSWIPWLL